MTVRFRATETNITLHMDGEMQIISRGLHPNFDGIREALVAQEWDKVRALLPFTPEEMVEEEEAPLGAHESILASLKGQIMEDDIVCHILGVTQSQLDDLNAEGKMVKPHSPGFTIIL